MLRYILAQMPKVVLAMPHAAFCLTVAQLRAHAPAVPIYNVNCMCLCLWYSSYLGRFEISWDLIQSLRSIDTCPQSFSESAQ